APVILSFRAYLLRPDAAGAASLRDGESIVSDQQRFNQPGQPSNPLPGQAPPPGQAQAPTAQMTYQPPQATAAAARPLPLDDAHIDDLLRLMYEKGSSDLHLAVGIPPVIRVDGALVPIPY